jgi:hypothetical protein
MLIIFCSKILKGGENMGDLGIDVRIILKWILEKRGGNVWTGCIWFRVWTPSSKLCVTFYNTSFLRA